MCYPPKALLNCTFLALIIKTNRDKVFSFKSQLSPNYPIVPFNHQRNSKQVNYVFQVLLWLIKWYSNEYLGSTDI